MTTRYDTLRSRDVVSPMHQLSNDDSKIDPKYKQRMDKQDLVISVIDQKLDILGGHASTAKEKIKETSDDLKFLDEDIENNLAQVNRTNVMTEKALDKKDCFCGFGYWPVIFMLIGLAILGVIMIVIGIETQK